MVLDLREIIQKVFGGESRFGIEDGEGDMATGMRKYLGLENAD